MICQCQHCGRVRIGNEWTRDASVEPDVIGHCPTCGMLKLIERAQKNAVESWRLLAQRRRGYGQAPADVDVFENFREKEPRGR